MPNSRLTEEETITRLAEFPEDEEAWRELYIRFWPFVFGTIYHLLGGRRAEVEDLAQDVFLRLIKYRPFGRLRSHNAFRTYLQVVCRNVVRSFIQRRAKEEPSMPFEALLHEPETTASLQDSGHAVRDLVEVLERTSGQLSKSEHQMLQLLLDGVSLSEMAEYMGISYANAAVRLHRLRAKLRPLVDES